MTEPPPVTGVSAQPSSGGGGVGVNAPILDPAGSGEPGLELRSGGDQPRPRLARLPLAVPILAIVAGVAGMGAGAYYLDREGDCAVFSENQCQRYHRTRWGGLGWMAGGVAAVGTGVLLAVLRSRALSESEAASPAPILGLSIGPGSAAVSGRF
jgi:hypothetical protein